MSQTTLELCKADIAAQISKLAGVNPDGILPMIEIVKLKNSGTFSIPIARINSLKKLPGRPNEIAAEWSTKIESTDLIEKARSSGIHLLFYLKRDALTKAVLSEVFREKDNFGFDTTLGKGETMIVEFSSPNIAKPFHAGHLRSTIIGNFLKLLFTKLGYKVVAINWLGDWGKQYGLLGIGFEKYGNEEELRKSPIKHLYQIYVKINEEVKTNPEINEQAKAYFSKLENGGEEETKLWKHFRDLSISFLEDTYKRLNVDFDVFSGESMMSSGIPQVISTLQEKNLMKEEDGAQIIDLKDMKLNVVVVQKSDGSTLYVTRDIVAAIERYREFQFEKMYYVVGSQQKLHFQQLFKVVELMGNDWTKKCQHVQFGMIKGMSSRKGTAIFLDDILDEARDKMYDVMKKNVKKFEEIENPLEVADNIGMSAVIVQDLSAKRIKDYVFNWDRIITFEGHTGPYLQYAHARLCSMERKTGISINPEADTSLLVEPQAQDLIDHIARFPYVIQNLTNNLDPQTLIFYLFEIAHAVAAGHEKLWVKGREQNIAEARMLLFWAAKTILANGLKLIGLRPIERM